MTLVCARCPACLLQVCAHGGAHSGSGTGDDDGNGGPPANSLAAFRAALAAGVECVEVDVARTADGVLVALHQRQLAALTGNPSAGRAPRSPLSCLKAEIAARSGREQPFFSRRSPLAPLPTASSHHLFPLPLPTASSPFPPASY